ncbi:MAG: DUF2249 domain-containing protein [Gammaproteobacteria bacterium]|nr:MAG: DUF2249 domain-containing protein [Gammaproteobacteria bacterium]
MVRERLLDVSALEPPEPLVQVVDAAATLQPGEYLRARLPREPYPLYPLLEERGFEFRRLPTMASAFEILIWRRDDAAVRVALKPSAP